MDVIGIYRLLIRRMESEIGFQFFPQPIGRRILIDQCRICNCKCFGLINIRIQAIQVCEQKDFMNTERAAIFLTFQQSNRFVEIASRQGSGYEVRYNLGWR